MATPSRRSLCDGDGSEDIRGESDGALTVLAVEEEEEEYTTMLASGTEAELAISAAAAAAAHKCNINTRDSARAVGVTMEWNENGGRVVPLLRRQAAAAAVVVVVGEAEQQRSASDAALRSSAAAIVLALRWHQVNVQPTSKNLVPSTLSLSRTPRRTWRRLASCVQAAVAANKRTSEPAKTTK